MYKTLELLDQACREDKVPYLHVVNRELVLKPGVVQWALSSLSEVTGDWHAIPVIEHINHRRGGLIEAAKQWCAEGRSLLYVQRALDTIYEGFGRESFKLIPAVFSNWMGLLHNNLGNHCLCEWTVPGTHYSAAYQLSDKPFIHPQNKDVGNQIIAHTFIKDMVSGWVLTQSHSVLAQLKNGIRFLNFEIAYDTETDDVYCLHTLVNGKFKDMLDDVRLFIKRHPSEVVYVNVHMEHAHLTDTMAHSEYVASIIKESVGEYLASGEGLSERSFNSFVEQHQNVILLTDDASQKVLDEQQVLRTIDLHSPLHPIFRDAAPAYLSACTPGEHGHLVFALEPNVGTGILYESLKTASGNLNAYLPDFMAQYRESDCGFVSIDLDYPMWADIERIIHYNLLE